MSARLVGLLDFIAKATPRFTKPKHMARVAELLERAEREPVRAVVTAPVRMGKSEVLKHGEARYLKKFPERRIIYASYGQRFAEKKSREALAIYRRIDGPLASDAQARGDWRTGVDDGGLWTTSVGGSVTGEGADLILVDDAHKSRAEAESQIARDGVWAWFNDDLSSRAEPGASIIVFGARWHEDDLPGRLIAQGWEHVCLPALDEDGRSLWPERFTAEQLREIEKRVGPYTFNGLYMQRPPSRGGALFHGGTVFYDELPKTFRIGKGIDVAYSAKTRADWSCGLVLLESDGFYYVTDVRRLHVKVPEFLKVLATIDTTTPGGWRWYTSTTEAGLAELATATAGVEVTAVRAAVDKFMRAQPVAAAWNAGKVLLPRRAPWLDAFVAEVRGFVGAGDRHDDQIDAFAAAFDVASEGARAPVQGVAPAPAIAVSFESRSLDGYADLSFGGGIPIEYADGAAAQSRAMAAELIASFPGGRLPGT